MTHPFKGNEMEKKEKERGKGKRAKEINDEEIVQNKI
jgi:hypothetical protein